MDMLVKLINSNKSAIIDDEDFDLVSRYKWYEQKHPSTIYARTGGRKFRTSMHRLIMNAKKGQKVDHINHDGLDNRKENLRFTTATRNGQNRIGKTYGSSLYKGVYWNKWARKWRADITVNKKHVCLGYFTNEVTAAVAYDVAAHQYFGEFAYLNFRED